MATGVVRDVQVVQALAIGRLSTGPNGLWIVSLGYQKAGLLGAVMALAPAGDVPSWWQVVVGIAAAALTYQGRLHPAVGVIGGAPLGALLAR